MGGYKPISGKAPNDKKAEQAWKQIMAIAERHALIVQANGERISREAFRNAERKGELAPHIFVENPTNAVCQECELVIHFEIFLDPTVKQALKDDANNASLEELETAERILDSFVGKGRIDQE